MRVMMLSWEYPPRVVGGLARHVQELSRAMASAFEVHAVTCSVEGAGALGRDRGVWVHRTDPIGPCVDEFMPWAMQLSHAILARALRVAREAGPFDIVHAHDWTMALAGAGVKRELGLPLVATIHATEWGRNGGLCNPMQRRISDLEWFLCYEAWRVIVCSSHMQNEVGAVFGLPIDKVRVIPNGVDADQFEQARAYRGTGASPSSNESIILFVGRLVREKGVHTLIEAMPKILSYWPRARLIVAGRGPAEGSLRDLAASLGLGGRVSLVGFVPDDERNRLYGMAAAAVVPSLYEPFGITALEAMAAGTPLIAADTGGLAQIVRDGVNGWRFYAGNPNSLADAVLHVLHCPEAADQIAEVARREVLSTYDWSAIARKTRDVYEEVLKETAAPEEAIAR